MGLNANQPLTILCVQKPAPHHFYPLNPLPVQSLRMVVVIVQRLVRLLLLVQSLEKQEQHRQDADRSYFVHHLWVLLYEIKPVRPVTHVRWHCHPIQLSFANCLSPHHHLLYPRRLPQIVLVPHSRHQQK